MAPRIQRKPPKQSQSPEPSSSPTTTTTNPFTPSQISLHLFTKLLQSYPRTVEQVHRQKLVSKKQPKTKSKNRIDPQEAAETITALTTEFLDLDKWRYETLPETVVSRVKQSKTALSKDDLTKIMQWKTTHGHSRPMLMGMIKSNAESLVTSCVSSAVGALSSKRKFPQESLDALLPLRGVGPATASLILSVLSKGQAEVPFYSDDVYLWVVDGVVPVVSESGSVQEAGVELKVKYNLKEYEVLWERVGEVVERLNGLGGSVSLLDIEKVAYVLKNIGVSGFEMGDEGEKDRKRKVEDEDQKENSGKKKRTR